MERVKKMIFDNITSRLLDGVFNSPSAVPDGLKAGNFNVDGCMNKNAGIYVGNVLPYTFAPYPKGQLIAGTVPANSSIYLPLRTAATTTTGAKIINNEYNDTYLELDYEREIYINVDNNASAILSAVDRYNQKFVFSQSNTTGSSSVLSLNASKYIYSIRLTNTSNTLLTYSLFQDDVFALPYNLWEGEVPFIYYVIFDNNPMFTTTGTDTAIEFDFEILHSELPTLTTGRTRPYINFNDSVAFNGEAPPFDGTKIMNIYMQAFGYGNVPPWSNLAGSEVPDYTNPDILVSGINSLSTLIGFPQYDIGFVGWQG